jgi:hypothetical protein
MGLLLILPILVSGYLVCMNHPYHFCRLHRYDGQLLYLLVAKLGLYCLFFALCACSIAMHIPTLRGLFDYQTFLERQLIELQYADSLHVTLYAFALQVALVSVLVPIAWVLIGKFFGSLKGRYTGFGSSSAYHRTRLLLDTPLGELLFDSVSKTRQILMLTMSDRKVYIGLVDSLGEASEKESPQSTFSFVPTFSGYRDKDTMELKLTTTYPQRDAIRIVLREENVLTATPWNAEHWEAFAAVRVIESSNETRKSLRCRIHGAK